MTRNSDHPTPGTPAAAMSEAADLGQSLRRLDPRSAADQVRQLSPQAAAAALAELSLGQAVEIIEELDPEQRAAIVAADGGRRWLDNQSHAEGTVGRLIERAPAVFSPDDCVADVVAELRIIVQQRLVIYVFVVDDDGALVGVVAFRELVFARPAQQLSEIMLAQPFCLDPAQPLVDAMREVVTRHYPVYPVCGPGGKLLGMVRGQTLFEQQAFEISAQAGAMVGVEREERLSTPWARSFRFRHPWLLINLLTVFAAAAVVGFFQDAIDRLVVLAMFLPVLAGQSGNLGAQSLAVTLRAMTLGELRQIRTGRLVLKEAWLGLLNGLITGALAAAAMYWIASRGSDGNAPWLAAVTLVAMTASCTLSGVAGALIPLGLKRAGADPATASAIFLSTATDVFSMGCFLALASLLLL